MKISDAGLRKALRGAPHIGATGLFHNVALGTGWDRDLALIEPAMNNAPEFTTVAEPGSFSGQVGRPHVAGRVDWLPWYPGALFLRTGFADILPIFDRLMAPAGPAPIRSDAPAAVDFTLYRHPKGAVLHVINGAAHHNRPITDAVPLAGFSLEVDWLAARVIPLNDTSDATSETTGTGLRLTFRRLDDFAAFALLEAVQE